MKILLLGATGRTGKFVLDEAVQKGYDINCLVREPQKVKSDYSKLTLIQGTPEKQADLAKAIKGCEAVVNVLNISRNSDFPWSKLRTPETFLSGVMQQLIPLAQAQNIKRLVVCSAWGVSETKADIPGWFRWFIDNSNIGVAYKDHERQEELLRKSNLPWTIVRPAGLTNFKPNKVILESIGNHPKPNITLSRRSLANYMIEAIENPALLHKAVVVSGG